MTEEIKHINQKNQKYTAEGNRMTKEIIVDGVNVAGCEFYFKDEKYSCNLSFINQEELCKCDDVQDCTYKQLKRLEQENKELKEQNRYYKAELKLSCNELDKSNNWQKAERQEKNKYRSALEEIKEKMKNQLKYHIT